MSMMTSNRWSATTRCNAAGSLRSHRMWLTSPSSRFSRCPRLATVIFAFRRSKCFTIPVLIKPVPPMISTSMKPTFDARAYNGKGGCPFLSWKGLHRPDAHATMGIGVNNMSSIVPQTKRFDGDEDASDAPPLAGANGKHMDLPRIERAVREILVAIGEDPDREGLRKTPSRVARSYAELMAGLHDDPRVHLRTVFHERYDEIVLLRDIEFHSLCEHHLLPFTGKAHVAYLPDGKVVGLSKLARLVEGYARRPQVQERPNARTRHPPHA